MPIDPVGSRPRWKCPPPAYPEIAVPVPAVVAGNPDVAAARRREVALEYGRGRRFMNILGPGRSDRQSKTDQRHPRHSLQGLSCHFDLLLDRESLLALDFTPLTSEVHSPHANPLCGQRLHCRLARMADPSLLPFGMEHRLFTALVFRPQIGARGYDGRTAQADSAPRRALPERGSGRGAYP